MLPFSLSLSNKRAQPQCRRMAPFSGRGENVLPSAHLARLIAFPTSVEYKKGIFPLYRTIKTNQNELSIHPTSMHAFFRTIR
jgi:hypothetical protein